MDWHHLLFARMSGDLGAIGYLLVAPRDESDESCLRLDTYTYKVTKSNESPLLGLLPSILGCYALELYFS